MLEKFGNYQLLRRLGKGGMAEVFLARAPSVLGFERLLAIKRLLSPYNTDKQITSMLADEARLSVWLSHPNIVQVLDFGQVGNTYYIAMEFVDGCDLCDLIRTNGHSPGRPLPLPTALYIMIQIAEALDYAHTRQNQRGDPLGIIHRDVSPHNVLISREGQVKLTDFGLARASISAHQSTEGVIRGKFSYMPKEQARGKQIDHRIDIFAAGVTLYETITGVKPYTSTTLAQQLYQLEHPPPPPSAHLPSVPARIDEITLQAMSPNPVDRYNTAEELAQDLRDAFLKVSSFKQEADRLATLVQSKIGSAPVIPPMMPMMSLVDVVINDHSLISDALRAVQSAHHHQSYFSTHLKQSKIQINAEPILNLEPLDSSNSVDELSQESLKKTKELRVPSEIVADIELLNTIQIPPPPVDSSPQLDNPSKVNRSTPNNGQILFNPLSTGDIIESTDAAPEGVLDNMLRTTSIRKLTESQVSVTGYPSWQSAPSSTSSPINKEGTFESNVAFNLPANSTPNHVPPFEERHPERGYEKAFTGLKRVLGARNSEQEQKSIPSARPEPRRSILLFFVGLALFSLGLTLGINLQHLIPSNQPMTLKGTCSEPVPCPPCPKATALPQAYSKESTNKVDFIKSTKPSKQKLAVSPPAKSPNNRTSTSTGYLSIDSNSPAIIYIDDVRLEDKIPFKKVPLASGIHRVKLFFHRTQNFSETQWVAIKTGQISTLSFRLH